MSTSPTPPRPLEDLFRAWREEDDSEALAEVMARAEPELFAVARRQAPDDAAAWDLVQETWLAVLRAGPRWDPGQRLMPWIVGILQIEVRRARRAAARTPDPARIDAPVQRRADAEAPAAEARSLIADALARLPDRYRDVLSMHLFDDLTHAEIAERTGREAGTVRVQVFRGLAQLRKLLPASLALGAALATLAPRSEAARLAEILDRAARGGAGAGDTDAGSGRDGAASGAGAAAAWHASGAARWIGLAAAALAVAGAAWLAFGRDGRADREPRAAPALVGDARPAADPALEPGADRGSTRAAAEVAAADPARTPPPGVWIVARVGGLAGLPPAEPTVTLRPADSRVPRRNVALSPDPAFEIEVGDWYAVGGPAPQEFIATYDHPHALPARVPVYVDALRLSEARDALAAGGRCEIALDFQLVPPASRVHGRVVYGDDVEPALRGQRAVAGLFEIDARGEPAAEATEGLPIRADGTFSLRAARPGIHRLVATALGPGVRPADVPVQLLDGEDRDVGTVVLHAGAAIAGIVDLPAGFDPGSVGTVVHWRPAAPGLSRSVHGASIVWIDGRFELAGGEQRAARDGAFRIGGLGTHAYELEVTFDAAGRPAIDLGGGDRVEPEEEEERSVRAPSHGVVLEPRGVLALLRVRGAGAPLAGVDVEFAGSGRGPERATTDEQGRVLIHGELAGDSARLRLAKPGWETREVAIDRAALRSGLGLEFDLDAAAEPGRLVLDAAGVDWTGASAVLAPADALGADDLAALRRGEIPRSAVGVRTARIGPAGELAEAVPPGRWWVLVRAPRDAAEGPLAHARPWVAEVEIAPGATLRVVVELAIAGRLRFEPVAPRAGASDVGLELVAADGATIELEVQSLVQRGDARQGKLATRNRLPFGARATSMLLEPGLYTLRVTVGSEISTRTVEVAAGRTTLVAW